MHKPKNIALAFFLFAIIQTAKAQLGFSHELGLVAGYIEMRSDFGVREDFSNNFKNSGFALGLVHYMNFSYKADCNCYTSDNYFNDHFKLRNEVSWNKTNLRHHGQWVDPSRTTPDADKLRAHTGVASNFNIGTQLEYFPLSIRDFQGYGYRFAPFVSLGVQYTYHMPEVKTTYNNPDPNAVGDVTDPSNFYSGWEPGSVDASHGSSWSMVSNVGVRYKLSRVSDLLLDFRWQFYMDDKVDGLDHNLPSNKHNDSLIWLSLGYIYYLN
ncbi:glutamate dehydrogenase [Tamlana sp. 2_MG-2023]|uniref:THC0290_0291 family protein n=1 Tax=unclassified Tamlana TaxID=2614803 RepID=UPI0026E392FA|nr:MULTISPECIES: glutamate dehydrogenase [unclassified Tamlana]MDO6759873.1 glutamate dehydrogenase [Tamlana sp. 2_MG-2023]MDO6791957.1 glutamate dehydrogenase [Tamlana sp. 1_MG-2023]